MKLLAKTSVLIILAGLIFSTPCLLEAQNNSIKVGKVEPGKVDFGGFSLTHESEITISGEGGYYDEWADDFLFYGWILNSKTREVVWDLMKDSKQFRRNRREGILKFEEKLKVPAGDYEVYYAGMYDRGDSWNFGDVLSEIFGSKRKYGKNSRENYGMTISGPVSVFKSNSGKEVVDRMSKDAIVSFIRMEDDQYEKKSFTLTNDIEISIYALGEGRRREAFDYGWIYDEINHKKVWEMNPRNGDHAGGGSKNIVVDDKITLPKGTYTAHYVTDDSHSYREWNVLPPNDPQFWGISIWVNNDEDMQYVKKAIEIKTMKPLVDLTRVRDDEYLSRGIKVKSKMEVRILCLGEAGNRKTMVDYGWIKNAETRTTIWEMTWRKSDHAGGAEKNRMVDEVISLEPGNYIVYYVTDDSHSYRDWNSSAPFDREKWGITLWPTREDDRNKVSFFEENDFQSDKIIAEIIRVRDDDYITKTFTLKTKTKVRIIAIGEGDENDGNYSRRRRGEMFDYGWIENEKSGNTVWEMTYDKTEHAGGGKKNRIFNGVIELAAGTYKLCYESDDSHSYRDWNDSPPHDADRYGITILKE